MEFLIYSGAYQSIFRNKKQPGSKTTLGRVPLHYALGEATHGQVRTKDYMKTLSQLFIILILLIFTNACQYNQDSSPEHILNKSRNYKRHI